MSCNSNPVKMHRAVFCVRLSLGVVLFFSVFLLYLVANRSAISDSQGRHGSENTATSLPLETTNMSIKSGFEWCSPLRYIPIEQRHNKTALASFPGSGNTWLRYLLQQVTGIFTGSVYDDLYLKNNGFPGRYIISLFSLKSIYNFSRFDVITA